MAKIWLDMHHEVQLRGNKVATFWVYDNSDQPFGRFRIGRAGIRYFRPGRGGPYVGPEIAGRTSRLVYPQLA